MTEEIQAEADTETAGDESTANDQTTLLAEGEKTTDDPADKNDADPTGDQDKNADKTADDKDETAKSEDGDPDKEDGDDDEAEPITYDDLKVQEGMEVDEVALGSFKELAAAMNDGKGLSQEDAQKLVDFRAEMVKGAMDQWETTFSEWRGEIQADKQIGGDNFQSKTVPNVLAAAEKYGGAEMVKLLKTDKMYGENPHIIRMLNRVGETLAEDKAERGGQAAPPAKDAAEIMYPKESKG